MKTYNGFTLPDLDINGRPFSLDLSPWAIGAFIEELSKIPPDHFALPASEKTKSEDKYLEDYGWTNTSVPGKLIGSNRYVYVRPIADDPELHARMVAYAAGNDVVESTPSKDSLEAKLKKARNDAKKAQEEVQRLEEEFKKESDSIKAGDWVAAVDDKDAVPLTVGWTGQVTRDFAGCVYLDNSSVGWFKSRFRKATPAEIAAELKRRSAVEVTVEGKAYKAEYHEGYVQFGCARIDRNLIKAANDLIRYNQGANGNRTVTAIQIGKGLFTADQIRKMAAKMGVG